MSNIELQKLIIQRVSKIDDEDMLNLLKALTEYPEPELYSLNEFEKGKIAKARREVREGKTTSHEEVFAKLDACCSQSQQMTLQS